MCPNDQDPNAPDAQLESLVAAAEKARASRKKTRKSLNVEDAENTLNSLLEAVDGAHGSRSQTPGRRRTQSAMEDLFSEPTEPSSAGTQVLVGLDDVGGVQGSIDESMDEEPTIAGAEDAQKRSKPIRKLDDGIDFWNELETIDRDPDADD